MLAGSSSKEKVEAFCDNGTENGRAVILNWDDNHISVQFGLADAVRVSVQIQDREVSSFETGKGLVDFSPASLSIHTERLPASFIRDMVIAVTHADGEVTRLHRNQPTSGSNSGPRSLYGGMWIDCPDWEAKLAEKVAAGQVSENIAGLIRRFEADGYVVIEQAVSPDLLGVLNGQITDIWDGKYPGHKMEAYNLMEQPGASVVEVDRRFYNETNKLLDSYAFAPAAMEAAAAPAVIEFMSAVFEDRPKAFQQLVFTWGSGQPIHKDTAYVKIDGNPMSMMATWTALEDISEGTGELEYYVGSHHAPDYIFGALSKWMEASPHEHEDFLDALHADAKEYGQVRRRFLAKAGDVLIWHADLAHGGSHVTKPLVTRKSMVTHFTASANAPYYNRLTKFRSKVSSGVEFVSGYSDIS